MSFKLFSEKKMFFVCFYLFMTRPGIENPAGIRFFSVRPPQRS